MAFSEEISLLKGRTMTPHRLFHRAACVLAVVALVSGWKPAFAAQTVVVGTGNPDVDVPAVQAAVNQGGDVLLEGHFSFNRPPTIQTAFAGEMATVLVSKAVTISGAQNDDEERASIDGGTIPFYVEAPGASVAIQGLRFTLPVDRAILVYAAHGLTIANCKIEGVVVILGLSTGIGIQTQGHPETIFGKLVITHNEIDVVGGTPADLTLGITVGAMSSGVGQSPNNEADIYIVGNKISNTTEPAIDVRNIGGRANLEGNVIDSGPVSAGGPATRTDLIRAADAGSYVIAHNTIHCEWPDPNAKGIAVANVIAVVMDNSVTMSPPPGIVFGDLSAGIEFRRFTRNSIVANNRIRGRARAALALDPQPSGIPSNNAFIHNRLDNFEASTADIVIGEGVTDTLLLGQKGTVEDHGLGTQIVRLPDGCPDHQFRRQQDSARGNLAQEDSEACSKP
jgi:hypothetical protein